MLETSNKYKACVVAEMECVGPEVEPILCNPIAHLILFPISYM